jgi:quercetin dioxygenase-like cupin family protein
MGEHCNLNIMDTRNKIENNSKTKREKKLQNTELKKSKSCIITEAINYLPNSAKIIDILKKSTGNVSIMSFDSGQGLTEKTFSFDTFVQVIEGKAEIVINKVSHLLEAGQGIVIAAHSPSSIEPNGPFKMILTFIKSADE